MSRLMLAVTFLIFSCATVVLAQPADDAPRSPSDITNPIEPADPIPDPPIATTDDAPPTAEEGVDFPETTTQPTPVEIGNRTGECCAPVVTCCPKPVCQPTCQPVYHQCQPVCQPTCQPVCKPRRRGCWRRR